MLFLISLKEEERISMKTIILYNLQFTIFYVYLSTSILCMIWHDMAWYGMVCMLFRYLSSLSNYYILLAKDRLL
jgi:hypothetical protein